MIWGQLEVGMSRDGAATKIKQNGGEFASIDVIFSIDNVMTYQYNLPFITTASSGCVSLKAKVQVIQCQSLVGMSWSGDQHKVKYR